MSGLDDPNNYTGGQNGDSPPACFNQFDEEGYFWFDNAFPAFDNSIFYAGDVVNNPFFCIWKVIDNDGSIFSINIPGPGGFGDIGATNITMAPSGFFAADWGEPLSDFSFFTSSAFFADGIKLGVKFATTAPGGGDGGGGDETIIPSDFVLFPECPGYGFSVQPQYLTKLNTRDGGFENVKRRWPRPINVYTAFPIGDRDEAQIQSILNFWHAMGGRATPFLIKDWADFKSCQVQDDVSAVDQPLETVTLLDASTAYQLTKLYTVGPLTQVREITQPKADTILIANGDGDAQTDFTLDESSGLLKPGGSFVGTPTSWGGEFYVPVRFDSELDIEVVDKQIQSVGFTLREKRIKLANTFPGSP